MFDQFRLLHLRALRRHPVRTALVTLAIACGVTLVVSVLVVQHSVEASVGQLNGVTGDVDLVAQGAGDAGLPIKTADDMRTVEGVDVAAPIIRVPALIDGDRTVVLGVGTEVLALGFLPAGCADELQDIDTVELAGGVLVGPAFGDVDEVSMTLPWGQKTIAPVAGRLTCTDARRFNGGRFVVGILPYMQRLLDRTDRVDAVLVRTDGPVDEIDDVAERLEPIVRGTSVVERPHELVEQAERMVRPYQQGLLVLAVLALTIAGFLTFNVVTMSVLERRHDLATVWAIGLSRAIVVRGMLAEAAILGTVGSLLGAFFGVALAGRLINRVPGFVLETIEVAPTLHVTRDHLVIGLVLGIGSTLVAAGLPTVQALQSSNPTVLRPGGAPDSPARRGALPQAALLGVITIVAGAGALLLAPSASLVGLGAVVVGIIMATFGLAPALAGLTAWLAGRLGRPGRVAALVIGHAPRRVWSTVMAIAVAALTIVTAGSLAGDQVGTFDRMWRSMGTVDVWVQTLPADRQPFGPQMAADAATDAAAVDGVASVSGGWSMLIDLDGSKIRLDALLPGTQLPEYQLASPEAQERLDAGTGVVISDNVADRMDLRRGDTLELPTPNGPQELEVVDVVNVLTSAEGLIGIPHAWGSEAFDRSGFSWLEVSLTAGADRDRMPAVLRDELTTPKGPVAFAYPGEEFYATGLDVVRQSTSMMRAMQWAIGIAATLAVASTMLMSVSERRRELGVLRAVGMGATSVRRMLVSESLAYGTVGLAVGIVLGVLVFRAALQVVVSMTGLRFDGQLSIASLGHATLAVGALALVIGGVAAQIGSAGDIDSAIRHE
jgi:putative ABC transport system permease protein